MGRLSRWLVAMVVALALVTLAPLVADAKAGPKAGSGDPTLTITEPVPGANHAEAQVQGTGFHPRAMVTLTLNPPSKPAFSVDVRADAHGDFSATFGVYMYPCGTLILVTATDSKRDAATGTITIQC